MPEVIFPAPRAASKAVSAPAPPARAGRADPPSASAGRRHDEQSRSCSRSTRPSCGAASPPCASTSAASARARACSTTASASSATRQRRSTGCSRSIPRRETTWIAGFSFGAWIGMQLLMRRPEARGFISIAPPANMYDFSLPRPLPVLGHHHPGRGGRGGDRRSPSRSWSTSCAPRSHITIEHKTIPRRQPLLRARDAAS